MTIIFAVYLLSWMVLLSNIAIELLDFSLNKCEELPERVCPACGADNLIKNGSVHNGKPKHQCKKCGRQFVDIPTKITILSETKQLIDRLLLERLSLRGIARAAQVSWSWLQDYVNRKLDCVPRQIMVSAKSKGRLIIECDEMWSFVFSKENEVYIWLAIDRDTREIVGCFVGNRTRKSARQLWASLPEKYQQSAFAYRPSGSNGVKLSRAVTHPAGLQNRA